jgi:hypothetical protein
VGPDEGPDVVSSGSDATVEAAVPVDRSDPADGAAPAPAGSPRLERSAWLPLPTLSAYFGPALPATNASTLSIVCEALSGFSRA